MYDDCCCPETELRNCCICPVSYDLINGASWYAHLEIQPGTFQPFGASFGTLYPSFYIPSCIMERDPRAYEFSLNPCDPILDMYVCTENPTCVQQKITLLKPQRSFCITTETTSPEGNAPGYYDSACVDLSLSDLMGSSFIPSGRKVAHLLHESSYWDFGSTGCNFYYVPIATTIGSIFTLSNYYSQVSAISYQRALEHRSYHCEIDWDYPYFDYYCTYEVLNDSPIAFCAIRPRIYIPYAYSYYLQYGDESFSLPAYLHLHVDLFLFYKVRITSHIPPSDSLPYYIRPGSRSTVTNAYMRIRGYTLLYTMIDFPWQLNYSNPEANRRSYHFIGTPPRMPCRAYDRSIEIVYEFASMPSYDRNLPSFKADEVRQFSASKGEYIELARNMFFPVFSSFASSIHASLSFDRISKFFNIAEESQVSDARYFRCPTTISYWDYYSGGWVERSHIVYSIDRSVFIPPACDYLPYYFSIFR